MISQNSSKDMEMENKKNQALSRILSSEARQRLERIRLVNKDRAEYLEYVLIHLASQNQLILPVGDEDFKTFIMASLQPRSRREINIKRDYEKW